MTIFFLILIILASVILGFIILVQNPKGGGLSGSIAGVGNQFMGVKQTNDVLEKGTWVFVALIALLSIFSTFFMATGSSRNNDILDKINTNQSAVPAQQQPAQPVQQQPTQPQPVQPQP